MAISWPTTLSYATLVSSTPVAVVRVVIAACTSPMDWASSWSGIMTPPSTGGCSQEPLGRAARMTSMRRTEFSARSRISQFPSGA